MVQDLSSQWLVAEVARTLGVRTDDGLSEGATEGVQSPKRLKALDLCAAPGGKSVGLAWSGFDVISTDLPGPRFALLEQSLKRTRAAARAMERAQAVSARDYDLVWVDAPCSGTGILRRHPDVRWLREEKDLPSLRPTQLALLKEAAQCVRPGGSLVYSVCSVLKEECEQIVADADLQGFEQVWEKLLSPQDELGGDGFWGCLLKRKSS
jgi:16S rRNA (cytosine967-C5)-methyltransferase